jgi:hypothetical protein
MTPQIIYIGIFLINLVLSGYKHGKDRTGTHNLWVDLVAYALGIGLLYWGGFFDPLFK